MDLEEAGCRARSLIRDRDGQFPALFDAVLAGAGLQTWAKTGAQGFRPAAVTGLAVAPRREARRW